VRGPRPSSGTRNAPTATVADESSFVRTRSGTTPRVARVLVVDDEPYVADAIRLVLSDEFEVTATTDPVDALERVRDGARYDVVLCDVMMPGMNGVVLRNRVHAVAPELAASFVFMTGGVLHAHLRQLLGSVPNPCLEKPLDFAALRAFIRRRTRVAQEAALGRV
jgi:CheY-like chemotaxis protein